MEKGDISNEMAPAILLQYDILVDKEKRRFWKKRTIFDDTGLHMLYRLHLMGYNVYIFSLDKKNAYMERMLAPYIVQSFFEVRTTRELVQLLASARMGNVHTCFVTPELRNEVGDRVKEFVSWEQMCRHI